MNYFAQWMRRYRWLFDLRCSHCGTSERIEIDHILPLSWDGEDTPANLQPLCHRCHAAKTKFERQVGDLSMLTRDPSMLTRKPPRYESSLANV
jgi:5-methylcytosine-specific restriction endonuclease McrA